MDMTITISRKTARAVMEALPNDTPETGKFFEGLLVALDNEQGADPGDREGIEIKITGTEF